MVPNCVTDAATRAAYIHFWTLTPLPKSLVDTGQQHKNFFVLDSDCQRKSEKLSGVRVNAEAPSSLHRRERDHNDTTTMCDSVTDCEDGDLLRALLRKLSQGDYLPNDHRLWRLHYLASVKATRAHQQSPVWSMLDRLLTHPPWKGTYTLGAEVEALRHGFNASYLEYMGVTLRENPAVRYAGCRWDGDFILGVEWQTEPFPEPPDLPVIAKIYALLIREHIRRYNFTTIHTIMHAMSFSEEHRKLCAPVDVVTPQSLRSAGMEQFMEEAHLSFYPKGTTMHKRVYDSKPREPPTHILYSPCRYE